MSRRISFIDLARIENDEICQNKKIISCYGTSLVLSVLLAKIMVNAKKMWRDLTEAYDLKTKVKEIVPQIVCVNDAQVHLLSEYEFDDLLCYYYKDL